MRYVASVPYPGRNVQDTTASSATPMRTEPKLPTLEAMKDKSGDWFRTRAGRGAVAAALVMCLLLGGAFLLVEKLHSSPGDIVDHPANALSDAAAEAQVVEAAKQIVAVAGLQTTAAGYLLMSCKSPDGPPYQGAIYLTFGLPAGAYGDGYFREIAAALAKQGWTQGLPPAEHVFGRTLSKDAVTAIIYRHSDDSRLGVLRLYGSCRNMNDHRTDTTAWIDITDEFELTR